MSKNNFHSRNSPSCQFHSNDFFLATPIIGSSFSFKLRKLTAFLLSICIKHDIKTVHNLQKRPATNDTSFAFSKLTHLSSK